MGDQQDGVDPRVVQARADFAGSRRHRRRIEGPRPVASRRGPVIGVAALLVLVGFFVPELSGPLWILAMSMIGALIVLASIPKPPRRDRR